MNLKDFRMNDYSECVKPLDIGEKLSYMLQSSLFDYIFTNKAGKELIEIQSKYQNEDVSNHGFDSLSDLFVKTHGLSAGFVYWIYKGSKFVELYKLKDFKVNCVSRDLSLLRIFFHVGTKFSLKKDKSPESHFVALELLKYCLLIAENIVPTKIILKYKLISFLFFIIQIKDVFNNMYDSKMCKQTKKVLDLINRLSLLSSRSINAKISTNTTIQMLEKYLSFLNAIYSSLLQSSSILIREDCVNFRYYEGLMRVVAFISLYKLNFFSLSSASGQVRDFGQTNALDILETTLQAVGQNINAIKKLLNDPFHSVLFNLTDMISLVRRVKLLKQENTLIASKLMSIIQQN